ncbi:MAG: type IV pilus modification protein PilV [Thiobacillaceae bacterium]|jgi:type IV pilus assembly protein PilV|nr:type IV pilus modification protein PilV [Thiobacillaceae bacterium]
MQRQSLDAQRGVSLLEVLVTVVVLSLGLLGVSGLQMTGLKNSYSAFLRAQAAQYAYDMADRMRANRAVALAGGYDLAQAASAPAGATLADRDRAEWLAQVASLPSGDAAISVANGKVTIDLYWSEAAVEADPNPMAAAKLTIDSVL